MLILLLSIIVPIVFLILVCKWPSQTDQSFDDQDEDPIEANQKSYERMIKSNPLNFNDRFNLHPGNSRLGPYGEFLTAKKIIEVCGNNANYFKIVNNARINGKYKPTEIDCVLIHGTGIYVFESKNFSGYIYGNFSQKDWTQVLSFSTKKPFYNPVWQNRGHISALKRVLGFNLPYYSIIVFSERCELKQINGSPNEAAVVKRENLERLLKQLFAKRPILSNSQIDSLYNKLTQAAITVNKAYTPKNPDEDDLPF